MKHSSRREFLQSSALLLGAMACSSFDQPKKNQLLSFSTLGCPDWSFENIVAFAVKHNYQALEVRGLLREMDLTKSKQFNSAESRAETLKLMKDSGLKFIGLGSSATLHFSGATERQKNLDEGRRFIDLAQAIDCPYVRVFPNNFPKEQEKTMTLDLITKGLLQLAEHAKGSKVSVLMETHGDLVRTDDLLTIMNGASHKQTGLVWDISNMWTITKDSPAEVYKKIKKYIRHTHIKDATMVNGKPQYVLLGKGEVPIFQALDELEKGGYEGYYSFEWEKLWHPEIAEPEVALADYPNVIREHFKKK